MPIRPIAINNIDDAMLLKNVVSIICHKPPTNAEFCNGAPFCFHKVSSYASHYHITMTTRGSITWYKPSNPSGTTGLRQ
jgi:hypothetical protein